MGAEIDRTRLTIDGRATHAKVLLEERELFLSVEGEPRRRRLPITALSALDASGDVLRFEADGVRYAITLRAPERWLEKIRSPRTILDKLGITAGARVEVIGLGDERELEDALTRAGVERTDAATLVLAEIATPGDLARIARLRARVGDALVLWCAWRKGARPNEDDVRAAAIAAGLVDVKVARLSEARAALKLVVRKSERDEKKKPAAKKTAKPAEKTAKPNAAKKKTALSGSRATRTAAR